MDRKIFVFWCGDNPITEIRKENLQSIIDRSGCEVVLVTNDNINDYIVEPFHEAYKYLSVIHKCDYWKAYFAYFHGCGYSDIKQCNFDWNPYFDELESNQTAEMISYSEVGGGGVALRCYSTVRPLTMEECKPMLYRARYIPGVCHYIYKNNSSMARLWRQTQHEILESNMDILINNPGTYHIGAIKGGVHWRYNCKETEQFKDSLYPFSWCEFGGMISHEIGFHNPEKCIVTMPKPICGNHWN